MLDKKNLTLVRMVRFFKIAINSTKNYN